MLWSPLQCQWQDSFFFFLPGWNLITSGAGRISSCIYTAVIEKHFLITLHSRKGALKRKTYPPGRGEREKYINIALRWVSWVPPKYSLMIFFPVGVRKAILDNLLYLEAHVSHANAMTTLTSPSLAAVTACLAPVWYVSQVPQAASVSSVLMDILEMQLLQRTVSVSPELLTPLAELMCCTSKQLMSSWVGIGGWEILWVRVSWMHSLCTESAHPQIFLCTNRVNPLKIAAVKGLFFKQGTHMFTCGVKILK